MRRSTLKADNPTYDPLDPHLEKTMKETTMNTKELNDKVETIITDRFIQYRKFIGTFIGPDDAERCLIAAILIWAHINALSSIRADEVGLK